MLSRWARSEVFKKASRRAFLVVGCASLWLGVAGCPKRLATDPPPNPFYVIGTVHDGHLEDDGYGLSVLRSALIAIDPDVVLTEIPPDRLAQALSSFQRTGTIDEPRVARFPEYADVLFPLQAELGFEIVPVAGWTKPMADGRSAAMKRLSTDPERADDWQAVQAAFDVFEAELGDRSHDPLFIHTESYDAITKTAMQPYAMRFANDLGTGDWETINEAHFALIDEALRARASTPSRIALMFGASHKYWFLEKLRDRKDVHLMDVRTVFEGL